MLRLVRVLGERIGLHVWSHALRHSSITAALDVVAQAGIGLHRVMAHSRHAAIGTLLVYADEHDRVGTEDVGRCRRADARELNALEAAEVVGEQDGESGSDGGAKDGLHSRLFSAKRSLGRVGARRRPALPQQSRVVRHGLGDCASSQREPPRHRHYPFVQELHLDAGLALIQGLGIDALAALDERSERFSRARCAGPPRDGIVPWRVPRRIVVGLVGHTGDPSAISHKANPRRRRAQGPNLRCEQGGSARWRHCGTAGNMVNLIALRIHICSRVASLEDCYDNAYS